MEIFWNIFFWLSLVGIVGIIAAVIVRVVNRTSQSREYLADASSGGQYRGLAERSESTNLQILEKLGQVESRLEAIEQNIAEYL